MKKGYKIHPFIWVFLFSLTLLLGQQASSYLTQKLMVESDLRERMGNALSKIIDDQKYIIDVDVDIEIIGEKEEQITIIPGDRPIYDEASALEQLTTIIGEAAPKDGKDTKISSMGLPIPGFDFEVETEPQVSQESVEQGQAGPGMVVPIQEPTMAGERVQSKTLTHRVPAVATVKRIQISIILQEGAAPELIENIRQVVMVASRFDRTRGDVLSIMTASFKERRDEKSAEQVLLKNIADRLEQLQAGEGEDGGLQKSIKDAVSEPMTAFKNRLNELEQANLRNKFEYERRTKLLRDSLQLGELKGEITSLREALIYAEQTQKTGIDSQLTQKIAMLDSVQLALEQEIEQVESSSAMIILVSMLGALVLVLLVLVIVLLFNKKKAPPPPPPWFYGPPPRKRKKKGKNDGSKNGNLAVNKSVSSPAASVEQELGDDPDVLRSEIGEMRQSVVSMSVGQPKTATRIVREWLEDDVVPEPEPPPEEPEEEDSGKKKKKKK